MQTDFSIWCWLASGDLHDPLRKIGYFKAGPLLVVELNILQQQLVKSLYCWNTIVSKAFLRPQKVFWVYFFYWFVYVQDFIICIPLINNFRKFTVINKIYVNFSVFKNGHFTGCWWHHQLNQKLNTATADHGQHCHREWGRLRYVN